MHKALEVFNINEFIKSKLEYLSIKKKLTLGFRLVLTFMSIIVLVTLIGGFFVRDSINKVIEQHEPTVFAAIKLGEHIKDASGSLGLYLLSKETLHQNNYMAALKKIIITIDELKSHQPIVQDSAAMQQVLGIEADIEKLKQYQSLLFELASQDAKNFPGIEYAAQSLNPISQVILNNLYSMIQSESEEVANEQRRQILIDIESLRYNWTNIMNGVRAYLAYRSDKSLNEIELYKEQVHKQIIKLNNYGDALTLDQTDSLQQITTESEKFFVNIEELKTIHSGEKWRQDAYLIRSEIGPILSAANEKLSMLEEISRAKINQANDFLVTQVIVILGLSIVLLVIAFLLQVRSLHKLSKRLLPHSMMPSKQPAVLLPAI